MAFTIPGTVHFPNLMYQVYMAVGNSQDYKELQTEHGLILACRPKIVAPEVKTEFVEVLGANGTLDLTGAVDGEVHYGNVNVELEFLVHPYSIRHWNMGAYSDMVLSWLGKKVSFYIVRKDSKSSSNVFVNDVLVGRVLSIEDAHDGKTDKIVMKLVVTSDVMGNYGKSEPGGTYSMSVTSGTSAPPSGGGGSSPNWEDLIDVPANGA